MNWTHGPCGPEGWAHLSAVTDCHDREVIGYELAVRGQAKEAERAIEATCPPRFGSLRPAAAPVLHSDNGLIFQSRCIDQACRDYRLQQEFNRPYTPVERGGVMRMARLALEKTTHTVGLGTLISGRPDEQVGLNLGE